MDKMEGQLENLRLSEAEKKGLKIDWPDGRKTGAVNQQALGKLLSEKPAYVDGMINSLGRVWCPLRGIQCKIMGENIFLFTFLQSSGKNKALNDGPWMVGNDLIVMEDFDPMKSIEEYEFKWIPIWIRVLKLPLGLMNRE